jgi:hypothetical protein
MDFPLDIDLARLGLIMLVLMGSALLIGLLLLVWVMWRIRRVQIPEDADFLTALRATPLIVVLMIDLLDFGLDFLSAPISWVILSRLGLAPLRGVTAMEALIPATQLIPTMTLGWIVARIAGRGRSQMQVPRDIARRT